MVILWHNDKVFPPNIETGPPTDFYIVSIQWISHIRLSSFRSYSKRYLPKELWNGIKLEAAWLQSEIVTHISTVVLMCTYVFAISHFDDFPGLIILSFILTFYLGLQRNDLKEICLPILARKVTPYRFPRWILKQGTPLLKISIKSHRCRQDCEVRSSLSNCRW